MSSLRAGVIGLGMMGRHHARVLASLEGTELVGAADPMGDRFSSVMGCPVVSSVGELIELGLDYCVVAVPTASHAEVGLALAAANVPALIEKPLAESSVIARKLCEAFEGAGLVAGVGHIERFNPALQAARRRLEAGELGEILQISTRRQGPFPSRIGDVGVTLDLATHDIDLTSWVSGRSYRSVSARTVNRSGRPHEDLLAALGLLSEGTVSNHLVNWLSPMKERVAVITGERGAFVADTLTADLTFHANSSVAMEWGELQQFRGVSEGDVIRYAIAKPEPLRVEHENFRDAVLGRTSDTVTLREGLANVVVAEAMLESSHSGGTVTVESLSTETVSDEESLS